jgi:hypothetical protein
MKKIPTGGYLRRGSWSPTKSEFEIHYWKSRGKNHTAYLGLVTKQGTNNYSFLPLAYDNAWTYDEGSMMMSHTQAKCVRVLSVKDLPLYLWMQTKTASFEKLLKGVHPRDL